MTDFCLPWKASHRARSISWGIKAHSRSISNFKLSSESWALQTLLSRIDHTEKSRGFKSGLLENHSSLLMECGHESSFESFWSHVTEQSLVEESKVPHQSAYIPRKAFNFQNVRNVTLAVQFHSWGYTNEWRFPSGSDCRPHHQRKWILASVTLLPSTDPSLLQIL